MGAEMGVPLQELLTDACHGTCEAGLFMAMSHRFCVPLSVLRPDGSLENEALENTWPHSVPVYLDLPFGF